MKHAQRTPLTVRMSSREEMRTLPRNTPRCTWPANGSSARLQLSRTSSARIDHFSSSSSDSGQSKMLPRARCTRFRAVAALRGAAAPASTSSSATRVSRLRLGLSHATAHAPEWLAMATLRWSWAGESSDAVVSAAPTAAARPSRMGRTPSRWLQPTQLPTPGAYGITRSCTSAPWIRSVRPGRRCTWHQSKPTSSTTCSCAAAHSSRTLAQPTLGLACEGGLE